MTNSCGAEAGWAACEDAAHACRIAAAEAAARESDWAPVFIITPDISVLDMGFENKSLKQIAKKHNDGFYIKLIDSLPLEKEEKKRLFSDADIQDAQIIESELETD